MGTLYQNESQMDFAGTSVSSDKQYQEIEDCFDSIGFLACHLIYEAAITLHALLSNKKIDFSF